MASGAVRSKPLNGAGRRRLSVSEVEAPGSVGAVPSGLLRGA